MDILILSLVAFGVSILTFFSGFGLGTILTPVFMIFFPTELAIALTGVVHFFNNVFKLLLTGKHIDSRVALRFGIPAVLAAIAGSMLMLRMTKLPALFTYTISDATFEVHPIKLLVAVLLIIFAGIELIPYFKKLQFGPEKLPIGGALSGFFGGLTGNQGALRSAFLIKAGLSKEAFIGTAVAVSTLVDFTRLGVYSTRFFQTGLQENIPLVSIVTLSAIAGAYVGNKLLKKVTLQFLQVTVAVLLIVVSIALGAGWI
ncbi:MAG: sulfite exporter TauE/SafE family protein [Saprospiraceae bacterium]|nr:sulfite exporter TauE/SafE family protein [Saprospiraceae bacterium]